MEIDVDGVARSALVHVPALYDPERLTMLVLAFHGSGSDAEGAAYVSDLSAKSDARGFIVAYPNGIDGDWNCCGNTGGDDVAFVEALIDEIAADYCVDSQHVFAAGFSNGGYMSYRLMCELSSRIAAIAPVEGALGVERCTPERPISVIAFHGTEDDPVPYQEALQTIERLRELNRCEGDAAVGYARGDATCQRWTQCDGESEIQLCTIEGGGHQWPGGNEIDGLGQLSTDIDASDALLDFFGAR
jgi:polyhydroxybutyrate depolymerase